VTFRHLLLLTVLATLSSPGLAEETDAPFDTWALEYEAMVGQGEALFSDPFFSENGKSCAQCHTDAGDTHPQSYPKYRQSQGRVIQFWEMVNWCVSKALGKTPLAPDSTEMTGLVSYITHANQGAELRPGGP